MKRPSRVQRVEIVGNRESRPEDADPFLTVHRLEVVNSYTDGTKSAVYSYDGVLRKWLDAVVLVLTASIDGELSVLFRSCLRPPLLLRPSLDLPIPDTRRFDNVWELPAGLIEDEDRGEEGLFRRASAEALEETGYVLEPDAFTRWPGAPFMSPGVVPERIHYVEARVGNIEDRQKAHGDGSLAEAGGGIWWVSLDESIAMCERGDIVDMKTELGLRRLKARLVS